jgi:hypothetical protein
VARDMDMFRTRSHRKQVGRARVILRGAAGGSGPVPLGSSAQEGDGAWWPGIRAVTPVGQADAPAGERVQMRREASPAEVTDAIRSHRLDRLAAVVDHRQAQAGDREHALEQVEGQPPVPLCPGHRCRAHAGGACQLALAEISAPACPPQHAGHVEEFGHGSSLDRCQCGRQTRSRICGRRIALWTTHVRGSDIPLQLDYVAAPSGEAEAIVSRSRDVAIPAGAR